MDSGELMLSGCTKSMLLKVLVSYSRGNKLPALVALATITYCINFRDPKFKIKEQSHVSL